MTRREHLVIGTVGAALVGGPLGIPLLTLAGCVLLAVLCMPGGTVLRRSVYASIFLFAANATVLTALAVMHVRCRPVVVWACYSAGLAAVALIARRPWPGQILDRGDIWSVALATFTAGILVTPFLHATPGQAMTLISQTTDGGNHTQLVLATQHEAGYLAFRHLPGLRQGMQHYPGAWSGNVWMLGSALFGRELQPIEAVRLLGLLGVACYSLLTLVLCRLALTLSAALRRPSAIREGWVAGMVGLTTSAGFGLFFLNLTSYTQIVAVLAIAASLFVLVEPTGSVGRAVVLTTATVLVAQTWYLLLPVVCMVALVAWLQQPDRWAVLAYLTICLPLGAFPVLVGPGTRHAQSSGPEILPTLLGLLGILLATGIAVAVLLHDRPQRDELRLATAAVLVACLLVVLALALVQPHDVPGAAYYTAKSLLVLLLLGATASAAVAASAPFLRAGRVLIIAGLLCSVWSTRHAALPPRAAHIDGHLDAKELDAVFAHHPAGLDPATDVWIADGCDRVGDLVATKWVYDLNIDWPAGRAESIQAYVDDPSKSVKAIEERASDPGVRSVEVFVRRDCQPAKIAALAHVPKVTVIRVP